MTDKVKDSSKTTDSLEEVARKNAENKKRMEAQRIKDNQRVTKDYRLKK